MKVSAVENRNISIVKKEELVRSFERQTEMGIARERSVVQRREMAAYSPALKANVKNLPWTNGWLPSFKIRAPARLRCSF